MIRICLRTPCSGLLYRRCNTLTVLLLNSTEYTSYNSHHTAPQFITHFCCQHLSKTPLLGEYLPNLWIFKVGQMSKGNPNEFLKTWRDNPGVERDGAHHFDNSQQTICSETKLFVSRSQWGVVRIELSSILPKLQIIY